jgi:glycosyltransferase involved in cell wall biosynthesis
MKVLQVVPYLAERRGGDVDACLNLSKQLVQRGHEVTVLTTDFELDQRRIDAVTALGIGVVSFRCVINAQLLLISPEMTGWLARNIEAFDIAHLHTLRAYQNPLLHRYAKKHKIPYILQAHGSVLPFFQKRVQKRLFDLVWGHVLLEDAARIIALNELETQQYRAMGVEQDRIDTVPNGIDLSEYMNLPHKGTFRSRYSIDNDECLALFLGRLHKIKGIDLLIKAFARLVGKRDKVKLVIAGPDAGALAQLKKLTDRLKITSSVLFTGPLYDQYKLEAYVDADVFILPSVYDMFPVTVLEAYACGTPVITTPKCGIADLVERCGYVVDRNVADICTAMLQILGDEKTRKGLGAVGQRLVREEFNWDNIANRIEQIYEKVIVNDLQV